MDTDLKSLEERVAKLIGVCSALRDENQHLRSELHKVTQDSSRLKNNMLQASQQLEEILVGLPEEQPK
ncbi:MAG: hypothetical protein SFU55_11230 [Methylophilus sp.]|nr:hypothetical protein [Methylophilus sp.]